LVVDGEWSVGISLCLIAFEVTQNMCFTLIFIFWKCFCEAVGPKRCVYEALELIFKRWVVLFMR